MDEEMLGKAAQGTLNVYPQHVWHDDVYIVGNRAALELLAEAVQKALDGGRGQCLSFANDGEGYDVHIVRLEGEETWDRMAVPYTADYAEENRPDALWPCKLLEGK